MHPLLILAIVFIIIGIFLWVLPVPSPASTIGMYLFFIGIICLVIWAILLAVGQISSTK